MKRSRLLSVLSYPFLLSAVLTSLIVLLLLPRPDKYMAIEKDRELYLNDERVYYADFDGDGTSEEARLAFNAQSNMPIITIRDYTFRIVRDWDLPYDWILRSDALIGDYDGNGLAEIYVFLQNIDSIFIHGVEPVSGRTIVHCQLLDTAAEYGGKYDFDVIGAGMHDMDRDGYGDLVFTICSGYSVYPRAVYIYSPRNRSLFKSPPSGAQLPLPAMVIDIDGNGFEEIVTSSYAPGNIHEAGYPYTDTSSWLMVFDHNAQFLFPPVENPGYTSSVHLVPRITNGKGELVVKLGQGYIVDDRMEIYDPSGKRLAEAFSLDLGVHDRIIGMFNRWTDEGCEALILDQKGTLFRVEDGLKLKRISHLKVNLDQHIQNLVPENQFFIWEKDRQALYLYDENFNSPVRFPIRNDGGMLTVSHAWLPGGQEAYSIQAGRNWHLFTWKVNPLYYYSFLIYFAIGVFLFLLIWFVQKVQRDQINRRLRDERHMLELQMTSMKNQLDPHFTLNVLNSIGSLYQKKQEKAGYYFGKYSRLIRQTLLGADKISVPLSDELDFIRDYLDLEQFRFNDRFEYRLECPDDKLCDTPVPRMLIHSFVENAVKHGLKHHGEGGRLEVLVERQGPDITVTVRDNGVGRDAARDLLIDSTGKGIEIIDRMVEVYNKLYNSRISYTIHDLEDEEGKAAGTEVVVRMSMISGVK